MGFSDLQNDALLVTAQVRQRHLSGAARAPDARAGPIWAMPIHGFKRADARGRVTKVTVDITLVLCMVDLPR